jgi:uncharacterized membrane protein
MPFFYRRVSSSNNNKSQNRQLARDKHESIIDFAINYKSEQEIDDMKTQLHQIHDDKNKR